jgi:predicted ThiF/HesA family dinucleotide-utilizing enzyme
MQINHNLPQVSGNGFGVSNNRTNFIQELEKLAPPIKNRALDGSLPKSILVAAEKIYNAQTPVLTDFERELRFHNGGGVT